MTAPDYRAIAERAVNLLCSVGCHGLHPSQQARLWQQGLDLDRQLRPHRPVVTVWTEAEGDIRPPRRADGTPLPVISADGEGVVTVALAAEKEPSGA
jgi:hypothetical protein